MKKSLLIVIMAVSICILGVGGHKLCQYWSENAESDEMYAGLQEHVRFPEQIRQPENTAAIGEEEDPPDPQESLLDQYAWPEVDFEALRLVNPDIVAWLFCEGTDINYPVVQGSDNTYYLTHLFDGSWNANGCLFLDCRVSGDFSERHSIIYGHHMQSGAMFASLDGYKRQEYFEEHPVMLLVTPAKNYVIELFAGYVSKVDDNAWNVSFDNEIAFSQWLAQAKERSSFVSDIDPFPNSQILTLSTCSYEFSNARYVVLGILRGAYASANEC